ncbi:MAG: TetR/AcrR family transcriptional regulator [Halodesulfurarchaeum sp.]
MVDTHPFLEDPEGTREAIMQATFKALCEYGYAGLTISRIGEHFEKSKSLLYHHYDSKDELLLDFLSFMLEEFEDPTAADSDRSAADRLEAVFDHALAQDRPEAALELTQAMVELRAQAAHDQRFREHFTDNDAVFRDRLAAIIRSGVESGAFREVDPDQVASFLLATITGAMTQQVTTVESQDRVRAELSRYVETALEK